MEEAPMAERSMRRRLTYSGAGSRSYAESLHWAIRWEGLRGKWFSLFGLWAPEVGWNFFLLPKKSHRVQPLSLIHI